jgi:hypothetical protein
LLFPTETFSRTCPSTTMSSEGEHYCITSMNLDDKEYDAVAPEILDSFRLTRCKSFSTTCPSTTTSCPMEVMDAELPYETSLFEIEKAVYKHESRRGISCPYLQYYNGFIAPGTTTPMHLTDILKVIQSSTRNYSARSSLLSTAVTNEFPNLSLRFFFEWNF